MLNLSALGYKQPEQIEQKKQPKKTGLNLSSLVKGVSEVGEFIKSPFQYGTKKLVGKVTPFIKDIGKEIARNIGSAGVSLAKPITKKILPQEKGLDVVEVPKFLQSIFKDEPIKSVELRIAEAEMRVKEWGEREKKYSSLGKIASQFPEELAFAGVVGSVGLDLLPLGGTRKGAVEAIKKVNKVDDAIDLLLKIGVKDDLAKHFAPEIVKTKSDDVAKKLLTHIAEVNKTTKVKPTGIVTDALKPTKQLDEIFKPIDETTQSIQQAKASGQFELPKRKSVFEIMKDPEYKAKMAEATKGQNAKVTKTSNNLYHTTSAENLESIRANGLTTGNKARFEGVSSPNKISFGANEATASYYGKQGDVMIRTKTSFKPTDLQEDLLAGGKGTYTTGQNIPPEMLEVKVNGKWQPLVKESNLTTSIKSAKQSGQSFDEWVKGQGDIANNVSKSLTDPEILSIPGIELGSEQAQGAMVLASNLRKHFDKDVYSFYGKSTFENEKSLENIKKLFDKKITNYMRRFDNEGERQGAGIAFDYLKNKINKIKTKSQLKTEWDKIPEVKPALPKAEIKPEDFLKAERTRKAKLSEAITGELGAKKAVDIEMNIMKREEIDNDIVEGIKNNPYFRKEKDIKDMMGEGWLMRKGGGEKTFVTQGGDKIKQKTKGKNIIVEPKDVEKFQKMGYEKVLEIDSLADEAGFDNGYDYLVKQIELSELPKGTDVKKAVEQELLKDKDFAKSTELLKEARKEKVPLSSLLREKAKASEIKSLTKNRRQTIRNVRDYFSLTDKEVKSVSRKAPEYMSPLEWRDFVRGLELKANNIDAIRLEKLTEKKLVQIENARGNTNKIVENLKKNNWADEDIADVVLEDGTRLIDTVKVKRNADKSLASVITKQQLGDIKTNYKGLPPAGGWVKKTAVKQASDLIGEGVNYYELPALYFDRKGLQQVYDPIIESFRGAEELNNSLLNRFREAGLFKKGGWFTADRFNLTKKESDNIGKYYLSRQGKGYSTKLEDLTTKEQEFVKIFDNIIKDTEERFYEVARKNGKTPGKVDNYAPIMTKDDIELIDRGGNTMDFIVRKHPSFFSLKERAEEVPKELYETDYRKVVARWIDGITKFNVVGDTAPEIKYLLDSEQFQSIVNKRDYETIMKWYKDTINPETPSKITAIPRFFRKATSIASLGLNYASVVKQALTQIPISLIEKAPPKLSSKFAKEFGISVKDLPSLTTRKGSIAIQDLQGKIGRIFTGSLTEFDRLNAQASLNALLDKNYSKFLKQGVEISPEIQKEIIKKSQDTLDLWYGGMVSKAQYPLAFRSEVGKFINMFVYPLTSQLNGFFQAVYKAQGVKKYQKLAEVASAAIAIAYLEQAISQLSPKWSDKKQMTTDVLQSLLGNIPIASQLSYALATEQPIQISAGVSGISQLLKKLNRYRQGTDDLSDVVFAGAELFGLPKQIRRIKEGLEIIEEGGITDKNGKILAPVRDTDELIRSVLRGKYGSKAAKDWIRNIGKKTEDRRWFVPQVEFLQNGDYERKSEIYNQMNEEDKKYLRSLLSDGQIKKLDKALSANKNPLNEIFGGKKSLESIFK